MRILIAISCLLIFGCSSRIRLNTQFEKDKQYFILQLEKADVYFLKDDVLNIAQTKEAKESVKISKEEYDQILNNVKSVNSVNLSFPIRRDDTGGDIVANAHLLVSLSYVELMGKQKFLVLNKSTDRLEGKIRIKKIKSNHGTRIGYFFEDGREFYSDIISIID